VNLLSLMINSTMLILCDEEVAMLQKVHPEWEPLVNRALQKVNFDYLHQLSMSNDWLPGKSAIFNAFTHPLSKTEYLLLGESPYPRTQSANGYAFWDANVGALWNEKGLSKAVNRATSLRNFLKMLLKAQGELSTDYSQHAITCLDKSNLVKTLDELFTNILKKGFILLNASLVLSQNKVTFDAKIWKPFMNCLLNQLYEVKPSIKLLLFGKIAQQINIGKFDRLIAEHPYNISFISNPDVIEFFKPLNLLEKR
jgi:uracil-DNA glycosylase